jgi:hypothetical protein
MARPNQKTISLKREKYNKIKEIKEFYEQDRGRKIDWSEFFLTLSLAYLVGRGLDKRTTREN